MIYDSINIVTFFHQGNLGEVHPSSSHVLVCVVYSFESQQPGENLLTYIFSQGSLLVFIIL